MNEKQKKRTSVFLALILRHKPEKAGITLDAHGWADVPALLSGMTADVTVNITGSENVLLVPADAVHRTRASAYVYTSYDEQTGIYGDPKEVTVGISNDEYTAIVSGLAEGDVIYYQEIETNPFMMMGFGGSGNYGGRGGFNGGRR